jgi:hypothetical protein
MRPAAFAIAASSITDLIHGFVITQNSDAHGNRQLRPHRRSG